MFLIHITSEGERWDQLANKYYGDPFAYERIIAENPHVPITECLPSGVRLLIPVIQEPETMSEDLPPWMK